MRQRVCLTQPAGRGYRWYNDYEIPRDALVPPHRRGATVRLAWIRPKTIATKGSIGPSAIPRSDPDIKAVHGIRNGAESLNKWSKIKDHSGPTRHAPVLGERSNHLELLFGTFYRNSLACLAYEYREREIRLAA